MVFLGWMVFITSLSLFSFSIGGEDKIWFPHLDKIVHFTFHFGIIVFGVLVLREHAPQQWSWKKRISLLLLFSLVYGVLIEVLQWAMTFDRSAEIWDVLANSAGAVSGGLLIQKNRSRIRRLK